MSKNSEYQAKLRIERLTQGLCAACGHIREKITSNYCEVCISKRRSYEKNRSINRIKSGLCRKCSTGISLEGITFCLKCWWEQKSYSILGSVKYVLLIQDLFNKQNGKCAISGLDLIIGKNASLDHIIPKSKGGSSDIANLQWVLTSINNGKSDMTQEEFIQICKTIVEYNGK